jgi:hypothetical protein
LTDGIGADSVLECVGTQQSMMQAIQSTRRGGYVGYVGVPHGVELNGEQLFFATSKTNPGKAFDMTLPLDEVAQPTTQWISAVRSRRCFHDNGCATAHAKLGNYRNVLSLRRFFCTEGFVEFVDSP